MIGGENPNEKSLGDHTQASLLKRRLEAKYTTIGVLEGAWRCWRMPIVFALLFVWLAPLVNKVDDTDVSRWDRSGMRLYTDNGTGQQYLAFPNGTVVERKSKQEGDHRDRGEEVPQAK